MNWWNSKTKIPINNQGFIEIFSFFVFECPSCIKSGGGKSPACYTKVSARASSFRSRGVVKSLLSTVIAEIRRPIAKYGGYAALHASESVEDRVKSICSSTNMKDPEFDLIVFRKRTDMSDAEAVYYYIRNAFAHGAFDVRNNRKSVVYHLESRNKNIVYAQMRLREKTLIRYIDLAKLKPEDIRRIQRMR